jgi:signal transduction histidine kinase
MKKILKHFAEWVTDLQSNIFTWARISITALYLLIILIVLSAYSLAMYFSLLKNIEQQITVVTNNAVHNQLLDHAIDNLQLRILLIDAGTFFIAALGSYWLAGVTLKPIKRALEAQQAFSADASHELRTPLAVMKTDIEVLLRSKTALPVEATDVLRSNLEEITTLSQMTTELLELSRGKTDTQNIVNISQLAQTEVATLQSLARQKNIVLSSHIVHNLQIKGSTDAIARVFKNSIANAIAYTPTKGMVSIDLRQSQNQAVVTIQDNGIGISPENLPHIFERFYKADNARAYSGTGSGLGLAIAKQIIEQHRGTITIQSELHQGTTVTITLPLV